MRRLFLTVRAKRCAFSCTYCFADFSQYEAPLSLEDIEAGDVDLDTVDVVYPSCDVDLFPMRKRWAGVMERCVRLDRSISVSTKAHLTAEQVHALGIWARSLREKGRALKVGVSASTMTRCAEIEPRAAPWAERVSNLRRLRDVHVPTCLVLKPLLPDVPLSEYRRMIKEASAHTDALVLGDEYLDDNLDLRRPIDAQSRGPLSSRRVDWLAGSPHWLLREANERIGILSGYARSCGMRAFTSDLDLMDDLLVRTAGAAGLTAAVR